MELGNILGKLKPPEKEIPKKFLALVLTDEVVQAAVWHVVNEQTEITSLGTPVEWDGDAGTTGELVTAADATISSAMEGLSDEPEEMIFGVPHTWTDKNGILGSKREFIKHISRELELKPLGFVVITDSILSYLKMQEGTPTTSILIQVSRDELTLLLVRLGRIEAIETIGRSDDVVEDTIEGISRFKASDNLPSRIILFNSMHNLDEIMQNLLTIDWQTQFNFLHIPKVETLAKDVAIRALALAGGGEVAKSLGFTLSDTPRADNTESSEAKEAEVIPAEPEGEEEPELVSAEEIGFSSAPLAGDIPEEETLVEEAVVAAPAQKSKRAFVMPPLRLPRLTLPKVNWDALKGKKQLWIIGGALLALFLAIFWFTWMVPTAEVIVRVVPKPLEQTVDLTLSTTTSSVDTASATIPATLETTTASGSKTGDTTGTKTVGDPADGDITIYNRTTLSKTFTKGTSVASGNLKFTLDADVTVASKSAGSDYVDVPGKANVGITAAAIGKESNLPSGTEFTILNFGKDSYVGKNDVALGGGTSEEIRVVGKDDQALLKKALTDELLAKLAADTGAASSPGVGIYLIPSSAKLTEESYSAKVGDKATSLTLSAKLSVSLLRYQTQDVTTLINSLIDQSVPAGYERSSLPATVDLTADTISESGDTVKGTANVKVALLPTIDLDATRNALKGKGASELENILRIQVPGFEEATATISPSWLPPRFKSMPRNAGKITLTIVPLSL